MPDKFVPESVLAKLVVGQRVRYVPDGPCDLAPGSTSIAAGYGATGREGYADAEGKTGVIMDDADRAFPEHPYQIQMDANYRFGRGSFHGLVAAAHELALVED